MDKYSAVVQWSEEDGGFIAVVPELPGLSAFGATPEQAANELSIAKQGYLEVLEEDGDVLPEPDLLQPYSGQTRLRLPKGLHASLARGARLEGVSLNTYLVRLLSERNALAQVERRLKALEEKLAEPGPHLSPEGPPAEAPATPPMD